MKKELQQVAKKIDEVYQRQEQLEKSIEDNCNKVSDAKVGEVEPPTQKVTKLALAIKESKNTLAKIKFEYGVQISELQIRLQPATPPEVREQRQKDLKATLKDIFDTVVDCGKYLHDTMQIWISLQKDSNIKNIKEELQVKKKQRDEILATIKTLPVLQKLASIIEGKNLQKQINGIQKKEKILQARNQSWQVYALKISQAVDERLKDLKKREVEILQKAAGPTIKAFLEEVCKQEKQMAQTIYQYNAVYNGIVVKIKGTTSE